MLTLKQLEAKAKENNVVCSKSTGNTYILKSRDNGDAKEKYKKWKEDYLKRTKDAFERHKEQATKILESKTLDQWNKSYYSAILKKEWVKPSEDSLKMSYKYFLYDNDVGGNVLSFYEGDSSFSCAVPEFGNFMQRESLDKHWDILLQWYVRKSKEKFFKCAVVDKPEWKALNAALKKVGFEKRASCKSNHGKYFVNVWEYIKK